MRASTAFVAGLVTGVAVLEAHFTWRALVRRHTSPSAIPLPSGRRQGWRTAAGPRAVRPLPGWMHEPSDGEAVSV